MNNTRDFHHPFTPYAIQNDFMNAVYDAIENRQIGLFESPTGTGKSLSLICASLTWLRDHNSRTLEEQLKDVAVDDSEPEWVRTFAVEEKRQKILEGRKELEKRLEEVRDKEKRERERYEKGGHDAKRRKKNPEVELEADEEDVFGLDDYESDDGGHSAGRRDQIDDGFSPAVRELLKKLDPVASKREEPEVPDNLKIFFCSRTHSQLTQFVNELRRVKLPPAFTDAPEGPKDADLEDAALEEIKHLSLGSRKNLCINPTVTKLSSATAMNEKCLDMQQANNKRCQYLPTKEEQVLVHEFRDHVLARIRDIDQLASIGKSMNVCPYYAARAVVRPAEIVTLPYPLLLQKSAREALDISLKDHVVIIDEAHNLLDAISNIHSITVPLAQLQSSKAGLEAYLDRFRSRLKGKNKVYVTQTARMLDALAAYLEELVKKGREGTVEPGDLLARKGMDQINPYKLQTYLSASKLARKVEGYAAHKAQKEYEADTKAKRNRWASKTKPQDKEAERTTPVLTHLQGFLRALTNPSAEGKVFWGTHPDTKEPCYRYLLLNPAAHFREIVQEARAVILAGGTMQPMADYRTHLFPYVPSERIKTLSCGHVIPAENLVVYPVSHAPSGRTFEFTFEKRMEAGLLDDLGRAVMNLCVAIPDGVVVFFPSYAYLEVCAAHWQKKAGGGGQSQWDRLSARKQLFREQPGTSSVEHTLRAYALAVSSHRGALLLSVVGGKMSEGINFNDSLGRGIVMVGLPFPNAQSAEWRAKLGYVASVASQNYLSRINDEKEAKGASEAGEKAKREFYENACMRAVNQSIGRAIRHRGDYAVIVLLDRRYCGPLGGKLPGWIKGGVRESKRWADVVQGSAGFFRGRKA